MKKVSVTVNFVKNKEGKVETLNFTIPDCPEESVYGVIKHRYLEHNLTKQLKTSVDFVREFFIESVEDDAKQPSFFGKSIFNLTEDEVQDFSTTFGLSSVPLRKAYSLDRIREITAKIWLEKVIKADLNQLQDIDPVTKRASMNFAKLRKSEYADIFTITQEALNEFIARENPSAQQQYTADNYLEELAAKRKPASKKAKPTASETNNG